LNRPCLPNSPSIARGDGVVKPVHEKAMPVMLLSADDVKRWLYGSAAEALELQKPATDAAIKIVESKK
jgi:putative SOS response-associated peptidase YedK